MWIFTCYKNLSNKIIKVINYLNIPKYLGMIYLPLSLNKALTTSCFPVCQMTSCDTWSWWLTEVQPSGFLPPLHPKLNYWFWIREAASPIAKAMSLYTGVQILAIVKWYKCQMVTNSTKMVPECCICVAHLWTLQTKCLQ